MSSLRAQSSGSLSETPTQVLVLRVRSHRGCALGMTDVARDLRLDGDLQSKLDAWHSHWFPVAKVSMQRDFPRVYDQIALPDLQQLRGGASDAEDAELEPPAPPAAPTAAEPTRVTPKRKATRRAKVGKRRAATR